MVDAAKRGKLSLKRKLIAEKAPSDNKAPKFEIPKSSHNEDFLKDKSSPCDILTEIDESSAIHIHDDDDNLDISDFGKFLQEKFKQFKWKTDLPPPVIKDFALPSQSHSKNDSESLKSYILGKDISSYKWTSLPASKLSCCQNKPMMDLALYYDDFKRYEALVYEESSLPDVAIEKSADSLNCKQYTNCAETLCKPSTSKENLYLCPLCQHQFTIRDTQMEIDAHIAACLASVDDDVIW